jgi:hypothetical protein
MVMVILTLLAYKMDCSSTFDANLALQSPGVIELNRRLLHTPFSSNTSSDEALEVAKGWITDCLKQDHSCNSGPSDFLPERLIDLGAPHRRGKPGERENTDQVRLILTAPEPPQSGDVYVTLSHCCK